MTLTESTLKPSRIRDAPATRDRILAAAKAEFAAKGLGGARVDEIAERADVNKRMIYHYFESKANLFLTVLEEAYLDIRKTEQELRLDDLPPKEALLQLVRSKWNYYLANPEFLSLTSNENLHKGRHLKKSNRLGPVNRDLLDMMQRLLARGVAEGVFREGVDAEQLNITIAAISCYYLNNRHTISIMLNRDFMTESALAERLAFNIETILRLVSAGPAERPAPRTTAGPPPPEAAAPPSGPETIRPPFPCMRTAAGEASRTEIPAPEDLEPGRRFGQLQA